MPRFDDFIVYVDESGDHSLTSIDPQYPMFVLACCLFEKAPYADRIAPAMLRLKFKHFGHDQLVLHEHDIRKRKGPFVALLNATRSAAFMDDLNRLVEDAPFTVVATAIQKTPYAARYREPEHPYHLAVEFCLERLYRHLKDGLGCDGGVCHVVFEKRGDNEDKELELAFRRVCDGANTFHRPLPFACVMACKQSNSTGLQLADLVARPVGLHVLRPGQPNRAWDLLEPKLRRSPAGRVRGYGLKVVP